jgi:transposase
MDFGIEHCHDFLHSKLSRSESQVRLEEISLPKLEIELKLAKSNVTYFQEAHKRETRLRLQAEKKLREAQEKHQKAIDDLNRSFKEDQDRLNAIIKNLQKELFGGKSEKGKKNKEKKGKGKKKRGQQPGSEGHGRSDHPHLDTETIELPGTIPLCPCCSKAYVAAGTEDSSSIEYEVIVKKIITIRTKYVKSCSCENVPLFLVTAGLPPKVIPKSIFGDSVWIEFLVKKYSSGTPIQRTIQDFRFHDDVIPAGTIVSGFKHFVPLLEPIYDLISNDNSQERLLGIDETSWPVFVKRKDKKSFKWWLWVFVGVRSIVFTADPRRSSEVLIEKLGLERDGFVIADRFSAYKAFSRLGNSVLAWCWAHVRRDFINIKSKDQLVKLWAQSWLRKIDRLYDMNRKRIAAFDAGDIENYIFWHTEMEQHAEKMLDDCETSIKSKNLKPVQQKVMTSLKKHWEGLTLFMDYPEIPMDNNKSERAIRPPVVGRKNFRGSFSEWSALLSAYMYTLFETLKIWDINPRKWLTWYFEACGKNGGKPPANVESFLPWNMSKEKLEELLLVENNVRKKRAECESGRKKIFDAHLASSTNDDTKKCSQKPLKRAKHDTS